MSDARLHSAARSRGFDGRGQVPGGSLLGYYPTRFLIALALSLLVVVVCFHLPIYILPPPIGWHLTRSTEQISLEMLEVQEEKKQDSGVPITAFDDPLKAKKKGDEDTEAAEEKTELPAPAPSRTQRMETIPAILDFADIQPEVKGGLGAYYLNIEYPKAAQEAGIQGRLVLDFVVETNGTPTNIHLLSSLHPLCDSAAVRALRKTRFIPGRQGGEVVRVKMRLPVRFVLLEASQTPSDSLDQGTR